MIMPLPSSPGLNCKTNTEDFLAQAFAVIGPRFSVFEERVLSYMKEVL